MAEGEKMFYFRNAFRFLQATLSTSYLIGTKWYFP